MLNKKIINPLTNQQQTAVIKATDLCIKNSERKFGQQFSLVTVDFDLWGKCAGMYQVRGSKRRIRFNPWIFSKYYDESISNTVVHEVAHYLVDCIWGIRHVKPHGKEWKNTMLALGVEPIVRGNYDLTGVPQKIYQRFDYRCDCKVHHLTTLRHRKITEQGAIYRCQACHSNLRSGSS